MKILIFIFLINACVPIRVVSKYSPDIYNNYTVMQGIQKYDRLGRTNIEQRNKDILDCGVRKLNNGTLDVNVKYPDMSDEQVDTRRNSIYKCLEMKGYLIISPSNCTKKGKPLGICN